MRRLRLTDTLRGIPTAALLKKRAFVLPAAENPPFRRKAGVRRGFAVFCIRSPLCRYPHRPARAAPEAASLLRPAGTVSASAVYGRPPDRRRRAPTAQGTRRPNEAPRAYPRALFMAARTYGSMGQEPARLLPVARRPLPHKQAEADGGAQGDSKGKAGA